MKEAIFWLLRDGGLVRLDKTDKIFEIGNLEQSGWYRYYSQVSVWDQIGTGRARKMTLDEVVTYEGWTQEMRLRVWASVV